MNRLIIILIILIIIIGLALAVYFIVSNGNKSPQPAIQKNIVQPSANKNSFEIEGMKVEILAEGTGNGAKANDNVTVHYTGTLENGAVFDSSVERNAPFTFLLGAGRVIKGWDLGVMGMKLGEKRKLVIPAELAYGQAGFPPVIPQNAALTFEVELIAINAN